MPDNSVDSVVTDPPYGLSFMGKRWDYDVPSVDVWAECLRVLKPGGHLLAFAGTRTQHRMAVRIEDAGFEIRDMIAWVYGSGFPKSLDVSKAIDKAAGAEREVVGSAKGAGTQDTDSFGNGHRSTFNITSPATDAAKQWDGWGTALKPALEPITVARKPLVGTVAENVQKHGTGALNVDGCRVGTGIDRTGGGCRVSAPGWGMSATPERPTGGRWPANLIHDGSEEVTALFPVTTSGKPMKRTHTDPGRNVASGASAGGEYFHDGYGDTGSAARFFYCAKASKADRDEGCEGLEAKRGGPERMNNTDGRKEEIGESERLSQPRRNHHPTVKPTALMRYLCRLMTPPGGVVLDPFMGSGSTGKATAVEGFHFIGIEQDETYFNIAHARIQEAYSQRLI